jgi:DNA-binding MarR family transcriptional regulator
MKTARSTKAEQEQLRSHFSALIRVFHVNERAAPAAEGQTKYSPYDFQTIGFLARRPGAMATELATFLVVSPTTATSIVDRLVKRGLVSRIRPETNRRAIALSLTADGTRLHQAIVRQDLANMDLILGTLSRDERQQFLITMGKIVTAIEALEQTSRSADT